MAQEHLIDVDHETGEFIQGWARIKQSIWVILSTRLRTRLMRLWWGSDFQDMMDKPAIEETFVKGIYSACLAINEYEPEFKVTRVAIQNLGPHGRCDITVDGVDLVEQTNRRLKTSF
jgi:phage baseplate assembly protein W